MKLSFKPHFTHLALTDQTPLCGYITEMLSMFLRDLRMPAGIFSLFVKGFHYNNNNLRVFFAWISLISILFVLKKQKRKHWDGRCMVAWEGLEVRSVGVL